MQPFKKNEEHLYVFIWKDCQDILLNEKKKLRSKTLCISWCPSVIKGTPSPVYFWNAKQKIGDSNFLWERTSWGGGGQC